MFVIVISFILISFLSIIFWLFFLKKPKKITTVFKSEWKDFLNREVPFYEVLEEKEKSRFEDDIQRFLQKVDIVGRAVEVTDEDRLLVAASAVIPLFGFPNWRYNNLNEVILYDGNFNSDFESGINAENANILGMVGSGNLNRLMILSKPALHHGFKNKTDKHNVGIHEFVHLIDKFDGDIDGLPNHLIGRENTIPWLRLMHLEMSEIAKGQSDINPYGLKNEAEFFSVVSEYFFSRPHLLQRKHPELFDLLEKIYNQDLS